MQLYLSMKPGETELLAKRQACLKDIKAWMPTNIFLSNADKTQVIVFGPKHPGISPFLLAFSTRVRNLWVIWDQDM